jgi:putative ATPase
VSSASAKDALLRYAATATVDETEQPLLLPCDELPSPEQAEEAFSCAVFEYIFAREPFRMGGGSAVFSRFGRAAHALLASEGSVVMLLSPPIYGEKISRILSAIHNLPTEHVPESAPLVKKLARAEAAFFASRDDERLTWTEKTVEQCFSEAGFAVESSIIEQKEERILTERDIAAWFDAEKSGWGAFIAKAAGEDVFTGARRLLTDRAKQGPVEWKWTSLLIQAKKR